MSSLLVSVLVKLSEILPGSHDSYVCMKWCYGLATGAV